MALEFFELAKECILFTPERLRLRTYPSSRSINALQLKYLESSFEDRGGFEDDQHHRPRMLPFRQFIQNSQQIDAGEEVAPAVGPRRVGTPGQGARGIGRSFPWEYREERKDEEDEEGGRG